MSGTILIHKHQILPDSSHICFVIPKLFSEAECNQLLNDTIKKSFQKAISNYPNYYRNNDRLVVDDIKLAEKLCDKVKPYLPTKIIYEGQIETEKGTWFLSELNNRLRYCKYGPNQYFNRHLDGIHYKTECKQSKAKYNLRTIILYGILLFCILLLPMYYILFPVYSIINNPLFLNAYATAFIFTVISLFIYNKKYLQNLINNLPSESFVKNLNHAEVAYLLKPDSDYTINMAVNLLVENKKITIGKE